MPYKDPERQREYLATYRAEYVKSERGREVRAAWEHAHKDRHRGRDYSHRPGRITNRPFAGFDGEGWDVNGRHQLMILRAGDAELYTGEPLRLAHILDWLVTLPRDRIYIGFSLGYDLNMMLRQLPMGVFQKLYERESRTFERDGRYGTRLAWWGRFGMDWLSGRHFYVRTMGPPGPAFRVQDAMGCFQSSFVSAVTAWKVADRDQLRELSAMKDVRGGFAAVAAQPGGLERIRAYNALECDLLATMMERVRAACREAGIRPASWTGAGQLAQGLLVARGVADQLPRRRVRDSKGRGVARPTDGTGEPSEAAQRAPQAYYGGFFDVSMVGIFPEMHEYDICSAYPHALRRLPCLRHARVVRGVVPGAVAVQQVRWKPAPGFGRDRNLGYGPVAEWGAFPIRHGRDHLRVDDSFQLGDQLIRAGRRFTPGTLYYPKHGEGWYWSPEVAAVRTWRPDYRVRVVQSWSIVSECDCRPFEWVPDLYAQRRKLGKSGQGMVLKLAMNSLYGKLAQRVGRPAFANSVWAGLITSHTRALIHEAIGKAGPENVVMVATDAVYTTRPIPDGALTIGTELGQWEYSEHGPYLIMMPGLHTDIDGAKCKTRGIPVRVIREGIGRIVSHWQDPATRWAPLPFTVHGFMSCAHAYHVGRPELAGSWAQAERSLRFGAIDKRRPARTMDTPPPAAVLPLYRDGHDSASADQWAIREAERWEGFADSGEIDPLALNDGQPDYTDPLDTAFTLGRSTLGRG